MWVPRIHQKLLQFYWGNPLDKHLSGDVGGEFREKFIH